MATGVNPQQIFITGCYRSGTTLLEKLLHQHSSFAVASQPMPTLFTSLKRWFLARLGEQDPYPLGSLFLESRYTSEMFRTFLKDAEISVTELDSIFEELEDYSGAWTPEFLTLRDRFSAGSFGSIYDQMNRCIEELFGDRRLLWVGSKEVFCEEYIPFLLERGTRCIVVVRDPRDVIASACFGRSEEYLGAPRPVLYSLRLWRKSVAFCIGWREHPDFFHLRYEDLVEDPKRQLQRIGDWLRCPDLSALPLESEILDQAGRPWRANSSFEVGEGVLLDGVGRYHEVLPRAVLGFCQACCGPELRTLGYPQAEPEFAPEAIRSYRDPFPEIHAAFSPDYSSHPEHIEEELERRAYLSRGAPELDNQAATRWFINTRAYRALREQDETMHV